MDLLTQLDNDIDLLLKIMSSSIAYVSRKASHTQLPGSDVPIALLGRTEAVPPPVMSESINELVQDLVQKANEVKQIILHLPDDNLSLLPPEQEQDLKSLQDQMLEANREYKEAIAEAGE
ncbi:hypothetical protein IE53DRAFT_321569 [Violaceomyces palustris]|uniref:Uncharacterized protein n=1 Tax=Violaceomyces palustris TaxID=1673888 RepID=A0ACD0NN80_9BASI|nr:hypothetical protein IE53DRAFT_321569 [Violaceomyces palustris]